MSPSTPALPVHVGHSNPTGDLSLFQMDPETGALTPVDTIATGSSSSFLAVDPTRRFLYATQNRSDQLSAFARDPATGRPTFLGRVPVPPGPGATEAGPSYLSVDATARFVLCANYRGHNTAVFAREGSGRLGRLVQSLSDGKHAHAVVLSPDNRFAFVPYLGSDRVMQYRFNDGTGALEPNDPPFVATAPGAGPRHLTFHPDGTRVYLVNELDAHVMAFDYDAGQGTLQARQCLDSLPGYGGRRWGADIHVHPRGRLLYVSNRAHDSLALFHIDPATGGLTLAGQTPSGGRSPRSFCLDPSGRFLLAVHQESSNLVTFAIDPDSGRLDPLSDRAVAASPTFVDIVAPV